jgi:hypothetical protein
VKVEDRLDGVSNFLLWKERSTLFMKEQDLWDIVTSGISMPTPTQIAAQGSQQVQPVVDSAVRAVTEKKDKGKEGDPRSYQRSSDSTWQRRPVPRTCLMPYYHFSKVII